MLSATPAPNWPHAIDSLYDNGKRRRKQYFPDGLPGMATLSKTEVADDIDLIESDADRSGFGHARRRACRIDAREDNDVDPELGEPVSAVNISNGDSNIKASKRQRLLDRILDEHGIREDTRIELTKVRRALDDINDQILSYRDGIARLQRQIAQCNREEASLKATFLERKAEAKRIMNDFKAAKAASALKLDAVTDQITNTEAQLDVIVRFERTVAAKNSMINAQQLEIEALRRELSILQQANELRTGGGGPVHVKSEGPAVTMRNGVMEVEEASGSVGAPSIDVFMNRCSTELSDFVNRIKLLTVKSTEFEQQVIDAEHKLRQAESRLEASDATVKKLMAKEAELTNENLQLKEAAQSTADEHEAIKKMTEHLTYDIEMGSERMSAYQMVVEAADQRAQHSEDRLHQVVHQSSVLKGANIQLQRKLMQLTEQYVALMNERDSLEKDLVSQAGDVSALSPGGYDMDHDDEPDRKRNFDNNTEELNQAEDGDAGSVCQQSPTTIDNQPLEMQPVARKAGRPSNKTLASRRRSNRN